jgi:PAS domain S-box-containing protein
MAFANQAAVVIHDTRLFEQAQREIAERKQIEERLARQAREMVLLNQIRMAIAREVDLPVVLKKVVEAIAHTFGYPLVSIYLLQNDVFILLHQVGYNQPKQRISLSKEISEEVIQKPVLVKDIKASHRFSVEFEEITSRICVPLFDQKQVIGILNVESLEGLILDEADLHLMTTLSEYLNIAIERANLFAEARGNEEKYNALIEQSNDAIYLIYGNRFEMVNRKFRELFGVTQKELNDPNFAFTNIIAPKSRRLIIEQTSLEQNRQREGGPKVSPIYEFTALDKDGKEIEVELSVSYPTYKGGLATQGVLRDITERKRVEAERATFQAQMFHSAKLASIGELAAGVAHEINNPIFSIREYADLILEETPKDSPAYGMLETIIREANRIAEIVRNLLEFSRASETNFNPIQLRDVWDLVYKLVAQSFHQQHIQLEVDIPEGLPPIKARGQQLQQVLLNLLTNARDALLEKYPGTQKHPQKQVTIRARLVANTFALTYPDNEKIEEVIQLTVRDEGVGISPENRERLFTPFFTTKRPKSGTGLGLSICHKIIEEHYGTIDVASEEGLFTEFRIILPRVID